MIVPCGSLAEVRANIDRLDRIIVPLLAERAGYVRQAGQLKPNRDAVVDHARIEDIIVKVRALAGEQEIDPDLIERIYRSMIDSYIAFEDGVWTSAHAAP
ncbi:MAG: Salicylate biosynthesis protein PchB [Pseudomonadota bacterium]|jgi:isochorismate pyruvate lyase